MPDARPDRSELGRLHERIDAVLTKIDAVDRSMAEKIGCIDQKVTRIVAVCGPCQKRLDDVEGCLEGKDGLIATVAEIKAGKTDTLSIKSVGWLLGIVSAFVGSIITGIAIILGKAPPPAGQ